MERVKQAVIIAAGEGSRLRPVTQKIPKPLIPVNGTRMIDTSIRALKNNGIHEIYIITGYRREQFRELYRDDPDIRLIENPYYDQGNNIITMYLAREHLSDAFVIEGDLIVRDERIFDPEIGHSGYCAAWMRQVPDWAIDVSDGQIRSCCISGGENAHRLFGVSMWTEEDGRQLSELLREQYEDVGDRSVYWDQIPLQMKRDRFRLGIREIPDEALCEIDTFEELTAVDPMYKNWNEGQVTVR